MPPGHMPHGHMPPHMGHGHMAPPHMGHGHMPHHMPHGHAAPGFVPTAYPVQGGAVYVQVLAWRQKKEVYVIS